MDEEVTTAALAELEPVEFGISELDIARARARYKSLIATSREGYEEVRAAIAELRTTRTGIEKRRVALKAAALEHGRRVDAVAKQLTTLIVDIEMPLLAKKAEVDDERERLKREAEKAELLALEAKLRAEREAEEARLKAEREAEQERLRVETARLAEERAAHEADRRQLAAGIAAAQAQIDADRRALDEQRHAMEAQQREAARAEEQRQQLVRIEQQQKAQAEHDRLAALQAEADAAAEAARLEALKPEIEKVRAFGMAIRLIIGGAPALESSAGAEAIAWAVGRLEILATQMERFTPRRTA